MHLLFKIILSYYFINYVKSSPKTSAETGNDIEKFLMEGNSVKELSPKDAATNKKPDKFMEDLIQVQRTYRHLKEKWHRMMEEKKQIIQMNSSTTTTPSATTTSSEIQEIDVDVFEAPDKFQDISTDNSEFDDEAFVDISATSSVTEASAPRTKSQLDEIQDAILDAFGKKNQGISLAEIIGGQKKTQMDGTITTVKMDQTTPRNDVLPDKIWPPNPTMPQNHQGPIMLNANRHAPLPSMSRPQEPEVRPEQPRQVRAEDGGLADQSGQIGPSLLDQATLNGLVSRADPDGLQSPNELAEPPGTSQVGLDGPPGSNGPNMSDGPPNLAQTAPIGLVGLNGLSTPTGRADLAGLQPMSNQNGPPADMSSTLQDPPRPPAPQNLPGPPGPLSQNGLSGPNVSSGPQEFPQAAPQIAPNAHSGLSGQNGPTGLQRPTIQNGPNSNFVLSGPSGLQEFPEAAPQVGLNPQLGLSVPSGPSDLSGPATQNGLNPQIGLSGLSGPTWQQELSGLTFQNSLNPQVDQPSRPAPFPKVATPWRHQMEAVEPAEEPTTSVPATSSLEPRSLFPTIPTSTVLPLHILPTSSFHSSGSNPDSLPATNLFRHPDHVQIPFFGAKPEDSEGVTSGPMRPTTPEPFRSEEIQNFEDVEAKLEDVKNSDAEPQNPENLEEVEASDDMLGSDDIEGIDGEEVNSESESSLDGESETENESETETENEDDVEEITTSEEMTTTPTSGIENNEDYVEENFSQETPTSSESTQKVPESFGIGKAPNFEESESLGNAPEPLKPRPKAFGTLPSSSGPVGKPPGSLGSFGSKRGPESFPDDSDSAPSGPKGPVGSAPSGKIKPSELLSGLEELMGPSKPDGLGSALSEVFDSASSFGIGRAPPGFSGPTLPPAAKPQKPSFPTLVEDQVENFFNEEDDVDSGASSSLGSFASAEIVANVPVAQNLQILDDPRPPVHMPTSRTGIFGTKLQTINQKAYKPPMFSSALNSETVKMVQLGNPYVGRTTVQPIGPHGLAEPVMSADMELPAWNGVEKDAGIMNKARREYQKEFEQQTRDVKMIDEEISRISKMNDDGRSKSSQRCSQVYAHTLSLPQIQKMSHSLGLGDVASVIQKAADLMEHQENDIAQLELDLEEKRKLIAKVEILLSLAESRALLFDLLNEQKKIAEKMENHALDLLQKTNFRPHTPSPFSAASDLSELSSAVQQVMNSKNPNSKKGWSMMKRKLHKKSKTPKKFEVIDSSDVVIKNNFIEFSNKKAGHLQETAEIVEPVLPIPFMAKNDQFGRQPVVLAAHRRPLPLAPPTMSPKVLARPSRPSQRAAHHLAGIKPLAPPGAETDTVHELIDMLHEDIVKLPKEEEERICKQVQCDFEKADLCNFESSHDETTRKMQKLRQKRSPALPEITDDLLAEPSNIADDLLPYTFRAWSIWAGRRAERTKQIDIGPTFSPRNHHFAAVFLKSQQAGILSIPLILSPISTKIRMKLFEGTRGIRLRVCCDRYCPLETEHGLYRGHRSWLKKTVTCPPNTQTLSFECLNDGPDRGACGIDEIFVDSNRCHHFFNGSDQN